MAFSPPVVRLVATAFGSLFSRIPTPEDNTSGVEHNSASLEDASASLEGASAQLEMTLRAISISSDTLPTRVDGDTVYTHADQAPRFDFNGESLMSYLARNLRLDPRAIEQLPVLIFVPFVVCD